MDSHDPDHWLNGGNTFDPQEFKLDNKCAFTDIRTVKRAIAGLVSDLEWGTEGLDRGEAADQVSLSAKLADAIDTLTDCELLISKRIRNELKTNARRN